MPLLAEEPKKANRGPAAGPENRRALMAAAREVYAESGLSAPFSAVAKRAGVGQGSLYRHFPDRTALALAVFDENVGELEAFAAVEGRTLDDLLDRVIDQALVSTALIDLLTGDPRNPRVQHLGARYHGVVAALLDRERAARHVSDDVEPEDVILATQMLATAIARSDRAGRAEVARRGRAIFHAALTAGRPRVV